MKNIKGFGDLFALVAQPVARLSDKLFGSNLSGCEECKKRHESWNKKYPLKIVVWIKTLFKKLK